MTSMFIKVRIRYGTHTLNLGYLRGFYDKIPPSAHNYWSSLQDCKNARFLFFFSVCTPYGDKGLRGPQQRLWKLGIFLRCDWCHACFVKKDKERLMQKMLIFSGMGQSRNSITQKRWLRPCRGWSDVTRLNFKTSMLHLAFRN